jgi:hypothetical protein
MIDYLYKLTKLSSEATDLVVDFPPFLLLPSKEATFSTVGRSGDSGKASGGGRGKMSIDCVDSNFLGLGVSVFGISGSFFFAFPLYRLLIINYSCLKVCFFFNLFFFI